MSIEQNNDFSERERTDIVEVTPEVNARSKLEQRRLIEDLAERKRLKEEFGELDF